MTYEQSIPTKILIVSQDEMTFQIHKCIATALAELPPVELRYARDATEALVMIERFSPDVVLIDEEEEDESILFIDSLSENHPPILLQIESEDFEPEKFSLNEQVARIPKSESLEGIHQTLLVATAMGVKFTGGRTAAMLH